MNRFENNPIVIEFPSQLADANDGFVMIAYNSGMLDIDDYETFRRYWAPARVAGKEVWEIDFFEDQTDLDPTQEVTFLMFSDFSVFDYNLDIDFVYSQVTVDNLKPGGWYNWVFLEEDEMQYVGKTRKIVREYENNNDSGGGSSNPLVGKWMRVNTCRNVNNVANWVQFNSDGTGTSFNSDCNSACAGYGINFGFTYTYDDAEFTLNYNRADPYCGLPVDIPKPITNTYSVAGTSLFIAGAEFEKQ